ncbi:MAG: hypothetical protein C5B47_01895 [Verrucomicrobia bacterium]|nr:MAG: hypothetical protein C5B47_01895 [Verrucomicrobiota bacterium]
MDHSKKEWDRKKLIASILIVAGALHLGAIVIAGFFVIARNFLPDVPALEVKANVEFPAKVRKHRIEMRQLEMARPKVSAQELLKSVHPTALSLPQMPPLPKFNSTAFADLATELSVDHQSPNGMNWSAAGQNSFFGVGTEAKRILILYDISKTVVNAANRAAVPMEAIKKESCRLIEELGIQCRFGLAQFARNYAFFHDTLLPATDENRRRAKEWLNQWFATTGMMPRSTPNLVSGGPGFLQVLIRAFHLEPEVIYILSDGGFYRQSGPIPYDEIQSTLRTLQQKRALPIKIHFFAIGMKDDLYGEMRKILAPHGGTIRKL